MLISFLGLVALVNMGLALSRARRFRASSAGRWPRWPTCWASPGRTARPSASCWAPAPSQRADRLQRPGRAQGPASLDRSLGRDRQLRAVRVRQHQLDRHPARRDRSTGARAPARPGAAGRASAARRDPGQLPVGLHRGNPLMTTARSASTAARPAHPSRGGRRGAPRRRAPSRRGSPSCSARA